jgi:hypothetical protein
MTCLLWFLDNRIGPRAKARAETGKHLRGCPPMDLSLDVLPTNVPAEPALTELSL